MRSSKPFILGGALLTLAGAAWAARPNPTGLIHMIDTDGNTVVVSRRNVAAVFPAYARVEYTAATDRISQVLMADGSKISVLHDSRQLAPMMGSFITLMIPGSSVGAVADCVPIYMRASCVDGVTPSGYRMAKAGIVTAQVTCAGHSFRVCHDVNTVIGKLGRRP